MEPAMKKSRVHVNSQARNRHNSHGILEYDYRNSKEAEENLSPGGFQQDMTGENAGDEQSQARANATAFLCDLDLYTRQQELEALPKDGYAQQFKQGKTHESRPLL